MKPNQNPKNKKIGIAIIVILLAGLGYFYFYGGQPAATSLLSSSSSGMVGSAELSLLNQMRSLKIDTTLFNDPAYKSLVDYSVDITPENVGRPNPFAPISGVSNPSAPAPSPAPTQK